MNERQHSRVSIARSLLTGPFSRWLLLAIALIVVTVLSQGSFVQPTNIFNLLRQASFVGVVAVGQTMVIITGGIDLSVGSTMAIGSVVSTIMAVAGYGVAECVLAALICGIFVGTVNGFLVVKAGFPPFIATLATMGIFRSLAYVISQGSNVYDVPKSFGILGRDKLGPVPDPIFIWLFVFLIGLALLHRSTVGREIYAAGGNPRATRLAGINVGRTQFLVYIIAGLLSGLSGVMTASRVIMGEPTAGTLAELDSIAAAAIGGASLFGGIGSMTGALVGTIVLATLDNMMNVLLVNVYLQRAVKASLIILAVFVYESARRSRVH